MIHEEEDEGSLRLGLQVLQKLFGELKNWWVGHFEGPLDEGVREVLINRVLLERSAPLLVISDEFGARF